MKADAWPGRQKRRETLVRLPLAELSGWHVLARCGPCRAERVILLRDLAGRYGGQATLAMLLPRLRCGAPACRRPPEQVRLRNRFPAHPGPPLIDMTVLGRDRGA